METFKIDKFAGMARAIAPGVAYPPSKLFNLNMEAVGGYAVLGRLVNTGLGDAGVLEVVGADQIGRATVVASSGNYAVIEDGVLHQSNYRAEDADVATHIPGFGLYAGVAKVFGRSSTQFVNGSVAENYEITATYAPTPADEPYGGVWGSGGLDFAYAIFWIKSPQSGNVVIKFQQISLQTANVTDNTIIFTAPEMQEDVFADIYFASTSWNDQGQVFPPTFIKTLTSNESYQLIVYPTGIALEDAGFPIVRLAETHKGRMYGAGVYPFYDAVNLRLAGNSTTTPQFPASLAGSQMIIFSDPGRLNFSGSTNFFSIAPTQSTEITALSSASGVLAIFFDNETWMLSGDSLQNFSLDLFPFPVGCDKGVTPAKVGGKVYPIWKGRIYEIGGGGGREISAAMYKPSDPFTAISSDSQTGHLITKTRNNLVFRYDPKNDSWSNDLAQGDVSFLPGKNGLTYLYSSGKLSKVEQAEKPYPNPELEFEKVDCQKPYEEKLFRRVFFAATGNVRRVSLDFSVDDKPGYTDIEGVRDIAGRFVFSLPSPVGIYAKMKFVLQDCDADVVVVPPIEIEYEVKRRKL